MSLVSFLFLLSNICSINNSNFCSANCSRWNRLKWCAKITKRIFAYCLRLKLYKTSYERQNWHKRKISSISIFHIFICTCKFRPSSHECFNDDNLDKLLWNFFDFKKNAYTFLCLWYNRKCFRCIDQWWQSFFRLFNRYIWCYGMCHWIFDF